MPDPDKLLSASDPAPFGVENPDGASPILFVSDHAGRAIPAKLGTLGLGEDELSRHIGYDIGIYEVTRRLAHVLDATYIFQPYSRLVIDCNRRPGSPQSVMARSDGTMVPGNLDLSAAQIAARVNEIFWPYQRRIEAEIARRAASGRPGVIVAMHSCTDRLRAGGEPRPWQISVIAYSEWRFATPLIAMLRAEPSLCVGVNQPYTVDMQSDYTVPVHAEGNRIPYAEIEIRQDLIGEEAGQQAWAERLERLFPAAVRLSAVTEA